MTKQVTVLGLSPSKLGGPDCSLRRWAREQIKQRITSILGEDSQARLNLWASPGIGLDTLEILIQEEGIRNVHLFSPHSLSHFADPIRDTLLRAVDQGAELSDISELYQVRDEREILTIRNRIMALQSTEAIMVWDESRGPTGEAFSYFWGLNIPIYWINSRSREVKWLYP